MSHHLKKLAAAGLVTKRREGTSVFYQRALPGSPLVSAIYAALDEEALPACQQAAIRRVYATRVQRSQEPSDGPCPGRGELCRATTSSRPPRRTCQRQASSPVAVSYAVI